MVPSTDFNYFLLCAIFGYVYLFGIYFSNRRQDLEMLKKKDQIKIAQEKTRIATEMHDDLGADLSNLLFKLRIYQNSIGNNNLEEYHEIENFAKEIIKKVNETIWTLNSEKDTLISLSNFILKFLDEYVGKTNINYEFKCEEPLPEKTMLIEKRRNIFHLFKETIKYIVAFDGITSMNISLKYENSILWILIGYQCNLIGVLNTEQQNLLVLMQKRSEILHAEFKNEISDSGQNEIHFKIVI